jgi:5-methylthioadenosine/S-adenosylhomocysteine deaminase
MNQILISGGTVITLDRDRRIIKDGAILIQDSRIVELGKTDEVRRRNPGGEVIDANRKLVLPGLIDTHLHLTQTLSRGLADQVSVTDWLYKRVFPYEDLLTPDDIYVNAQLASLEMIRTGTTCFADPGGYQMENAGRAIEESGIRGILAVASIDEEDASHPLPKRFRTTTDEAIRETENLMRAFNGKANGRIRVWAALRGMLNDSKELILRMDDLAKKHGTGIEAHVSFWRDNVEWLRKTKGLTDVRYLESLGVLGPNWLMSHMGWVEDEEIEIVMKHKVKVSYCPGSGMKMPLGTNMNGKIPKMLNRGVNISLGCDSTSACNSLDMFRAMWAASTINKEMHLDPLLISPEQVLEMATINGAEGLLWEDEIGSIEAGKRADIIIINPRRSNLVPFQNFSLVPNIVYSGEGSNVETVLVDGRILMNNGEILTINQYAILEQAQRAHDRITDAIGFKIKPSWNFA